MSRVVGMLNLLMGFAYQNLTIVIKKWATKVMKCITARLSFEVLRCKIKGQLAETSFALQESHRRWALQDNHLGKLGMHIVILLLVLEVGEQIFTFHHISYLHCQSYFAK